MSVFSYLFHDVFLAITALFGLGWGMMMFMFMWYGDGDSYKPVKVTIAGGRDWTNLLRVLRVVLMVLSASLLIGLSAALFWSVFWLSTGVAWFFADSGYGFLGWIGLGLFLLASAVAAIWPKKVPAGGGA